MSSYDEYENKCDYCNSTSRVDDYMPGLCKWCAEEYADCSKHNGYYTEGHKNYHPKEDENPKHDTAEHDKLCRGSGRNDELEEREAKIQEKDDEIEKLKVELEEKNDEIEELKVKLEGKDKELEKQLVKLEMVKFLEFHIVDIISDYLLSTENLTKKVNLDYSFL
jgi:hypothetical protein